MHKAVQDRQQSEHDEKHGKPFQVNNASKVKFHLLLLLKKTWLFMYRAVFVVRPA